MVRLLVGFCQRVRRLGVMWQGAKQRWPQRIVCSPGTGCCLTLLHCATHCEPGTRG
jgi:hypothetical protein